MYCSSSKIAQFSAIKRANKKIQRYREYKIPIKAIRLKVTSERFIIASEILWAIPDISQIQQQYHLLYY